MSRIKVTQVGAILLLLFSGASLSVSASEHEEPEAEASHKEEKADAEDAHGSEKSAPEKKKKADDHGGEAEHGSGDKAASGDHGGGGGEHSGPVERTGAIYVPFKPAFVVNYGGPGRLKYIKTDMTVRVQDSKTATAVQRHMPYLRNNIVMLLSSQTEENVSSQEGKEALRKAALEKVRELIHTEEKLDGIIDLYFNAFLVQH